MEEVTVDELLVSSYPTRNEMGAAAAKEVALRLKSLLSEKNFVNMIFAAAPSQNEFLQFLVAQDGIEWSRVNAFHMDEYIGLSKDAPQGFGNFLKEKLFNKIPFGKVFYLNGNAPDPRDECRRYANLLRQHPTDIVCMGIGENTHIAFNDPHVADFNDPEIVKIVDLDEVCRRQQVNDGCFDHIDRVPVSALTLTVPALVCADYLFCIVPGKNKSAAVKYTLTEAISERYPASILRKHKNGRLFLDKNSAELLKELGINQEVKAQG